MGSRIKGRIINAANQEPVAGAKIVVAATTPQRVSVCDPEDLNTISFEETVMSDTNGEFSTRNFVEINVLAQVTVSVAGCKTLQTSLGGRFLGEIENYLGTREPSLPTLELDCGS